MYAMMPAIAIADARKRKARVRRQTYDRRHPRLRLFSRANPAENAIAEPRTLADVAIRLSIAVNEWRRSASNMRNLLEADSHAAAIVVGQSVS
jgi:hypothetical protein